MTSTCGCSAADIQRQLPAEAKAFAQVDRTFKDVMRRTKDRPNAMQAATTPGLLEVFQKCNATLEVVQKVRSQGMGVTCRFGCSNSK